MSIVHGGNLEKLAAEAHCAPDEILDFSVNLNPCGQPEGLFQVWFRAFDHAAPYPEPYAESVCRMIAGKLSCPADCVLAGNGSGELLDLLPRAFDSRRAVIVTPGYLEYEESCRKAGLPVTHFTLREEEDFQLDMEALDSSLLSGDLVMLGNPANPVGAALEPERLLALIRERRDCNFIIDEAFVDFCPDYSLKNTILPNLAVTHSMTKFYSLAGVRMGYVLADASVTARLKELQPCWSLGSAGCELMKFLFSLDDAFAETSRRETERLRSEFSARLARIPGVKVYPSAANYLLVRLPRPLLADRLLKEHHIAVRDCGGYPGLSAGHIRVAVRKESENRLLLSALECVCGQNGGIAPEVPGKWNKTGGKTRRTPALMLQGTCSNAGKSILAAAFCRIMLQDGIRVAPFKAQNMALNSFVTMDGGEMGRAQAVQAEACRLDPDVRMNPILLKPNSDTGSQVIVCGKPVGNMRVREYYAHKKELWEKVKESYDSLCASYQAIVLEGAGSPGEINLKKSDIVNMRMAQYAQSPVLLVGDIDRGGVYASFIGTYATLENWERELLKGFLVNKFRGDPTLLDDAHRDVLAYTGRPVMGVIDWQRDLGLPEEDSVNFSLVRPAPKHAKTLDAVLIHLGHIANFTDFVPFELEPDVTVRKIDSAAEFGSPDLVIVPGSKGTAADMSELEKRGLARKIREAVKNGAWYVGICGGLQIAGERLLDPLAVESDCPDAACLGLLPLVTEMMPEKTLRQTRAECFGMPVSGYEIHHGKTRMTASVESVSVADNGTVAGYSSGRVFTSYLHGVFDDDAFRRNFIDRVRVSLGWKPLGGVTAHYGIEDSLNRLADHVRSRVDMKKIYRMMGL